MITLLRRFGLLVCKLGLIIKIYLRVAEGLRENSV